MDKKYKLTDNIKDDFGHTLHQIKALKDFGKVKKGDLGGWVENPNNLSQTGTSWVYDGAMIEENAQVLGDSQVYDNALVYGNAKIYDNVLIYGNAQVHDNVHIYDNAQVYGDSMVEDNVLVCDNAQVYGRARVYGNAHVFDNAIVCDVVRAYDNARFYDNAQVYGDAKVYGDARIYDSAHVCGRATILGNTRVCGNAKVYGDSSIDGDIFIRENDEIKDNKSYLVFKNIWSSGREFVYVLSNHRWHVGCFDGTGEELIKKAYQDSEVSGEMYEMYVHFVENVVETRQRNMGLDNVQ